MEKNNLIFYLDLLGFFFFSLNLLVVPLNFMGVLPPGDTFFWNSPYELLCLTPLSIILQLYRDGQFLLIEKTTDLPQVTDKFDHIMLY